MIRKLAELVSDPPVDESAVARTARLILEIKPGERRLRPDFGCRAHSLPRLSNERDLQLAAVFIEEALAEWAPQLRVERADVLAAADGMVRVALRAGGVWHALVFRHRPGGGPTMRVFGEADQP